MARFATSYLDCPSASATGWSSARRRRSSCALGYRRGGRDFPVFLHPQTGEEYALARTERKTGPGLSRLLRAQCARRYAGAGSASGATSPSTPWRARPSGTLIDPYGGQRDLQARACCATCPPPSSRIRCASCAWRASLPASRRSASSWRPETLALMQRMVASGESDALVPERVWAETEKALHHGASGRVLSQCCASAARWRCCSRSWSALFGVPQPAALASRDRHRRAHVDGAGAGGALVATIRACVSRR